MADPLAPVCWPLASHAEGVATLESLRRLAAADRRVGLIIGEAGSGKTCILRAFLALYGEAHYCQVPPRAVLKARSLLDVVGEPLLMSYGYLTKAEIYNKVKRALAESWQLMVIDEADRLNLAMLDLLRDLAESSQAPFCLAGCPSLERLVQRVPPLASRVCLRYRVPPLQVEEVVAIIGHGSAFAQEHGIPTWPHATVAAAVKETNGNLRQLRALLAQLAFAQDGGLVLSGRSESFQQAAVHKIADEYLFRVA